MTAYAMGFGDRVHLTLCVNMGLSGVNRAKFSRHGAEYSARSRLGEL